MAASIVNSLKARTLVFTVPKGVKFQYADFLPFIGRNSVGIEAFGTVGVGYVWHLTLKTLEFLNDILSNVDQSGHFSIGDIQVHVSKYSDIQNTATLFWLPYWVCHQDVQSSISKLSGYKIACSYIRIPQKGYQGCYSTQRRLVSPSGFDKLPHFIPIESEGETYRCFLFVPGRPTICFACQELGHMKSSCPNQRKTTIVADVPIEVAIEADSNEQSMVEGTITPGAPQKTVPSPEPLSPVTPLNMSSNLLSTPEKKIPSPGSLSPVSPVIFPTNLLSTPEKRIPSPLPLSPLPLHKIVTPAASAGSGSKSPVRSDVHQNDFYSDQQDIPDQELIIREPCAYGVLYTDYRGKERPLKIGGDRAVIYPPLKPLLTVKVFHGLAKGCTPSRCNAMKEFVDGNISVEVMDNHFQHHHPTHEVIRL
jgi:hypothetical protein